MRLPDFFHRFLHKHWLQHYLPEATMPAHTLDCPECGLRVNVPKLRQGYRAVCPRCDHHLAHIEINAYTLVLACAMAALLLMLPVYCLPFVNVQMAGMYSPLTLPNMVYFLLAEDWGFLGLLMFTLTFGTPLLFVILAIYVYINLLKKKQENPYLLRAIRLLSYLRQWIMIDVFFISMLVAYIKMRTMAQVEFGVAFWLMPFLVILLLRTAKAIPQHWLYGQMAHYCGVPTLQAASNTLCCSRCLYFQPKHLPQCGVCGSDLFNRRPNSLKISSMLLLAAAILYIPANTLPIMVSENPMKSKVSTIIGGIIYMWKTGDQLIAVVIFGASVVVPILKIILISWLLWNAKFTPLQSAQRLTRQYRIVEIIGRWSMIDIFVIIILMSTFHSPIARVTSGPAALYFSLVVILTMWSAYFFDMRLIWDKHHQMLPEKRAL